ncbi:MAG: 2-hydroxyacid dehydrogenase [Candidatus Woesearchaeota archaeon]
MKISFIGDFLPMGKYENFLKKDFIIQMHPSKNSNDEMYECVKGAEIIVTHDRFDSELIQRLDGLKLLISWSTGLDNIDIEAARNKGIQVINTKNYCSQAVAEHVFSLIFSLARKIPQAIAEVNNRSWDCLPYKGIELKGKTLGLVGYGNIGKIVDKTAQALDMKTLINCRSKLALPNYCSLDVLLMKSDFVCLCLSLNESSELLLDSTKFDIMKSTAFLVNISRGKIINEDHLIDALMKRKISGAGLDVINDEPKVSQKLIGVPNLIITPHIAWLTEESVAAGAKLIYDIIKGYSK